MFYEVAVLFVQLTYLHVFYLFATIHYSFKESKFFSRNVLNELFVFFCEISMLEAFSSLVFGLHFPLLLNMWGLFAKQVALFADVSNAVITSYFP